MKQDDQITQAREELERHPPGDTGRAGAFYNLARSLVNRFKETNDAANLDEAIELQRSALDLRPKGHPDRHWSLYLLAWCLLERYNKHGTLPNLEEATTLQRAALKLRPEGHPNRSDSLHHLASAVGAWYDKYAFMADLEEAIALYRAALKLRHPDHPYCVETLGNLASSLRYRFLKLGKSADLEEAISLQRSVLDTLSEGQPERPWALDKLALSLNDRYKRHASLANLEEAITLNRVALELYPSGHPNRASSLGNLGLFLRNRFLELKVNPDIDEAISLYRSALDLCPVGHPKRQVFLKGLVACLSHQFNERPEMATALDELIALHQAIFSLYSPDQHDDHATSIDKLLLHVRKRAWTLGIPAALEECITVGQSALALPEARNPGQLACIHCLAANLHNGFRKHENIPDVPEAHPDHATALRHLQVYVKGLIDEGNIIMNIEGIVAIALAACRLRPPHHSDYVMSLFVALATFHRCKFQLQDTVTDLDTAIMLHREISEAHQSENPTRAEHMHKFAWCLSQRSAKLSTWNDLEDAIKFEQAALFLRPRGHRDRAESLVSLANYQRMKISRKGANPRLSHHRGLTGNLTIEEIVGNIIFEALKPFPPRLVDTHAGTLCTRGAQILHFKSSQEYKQLMSSASAPNTLPPTTHIHEVISTYFQYATLSHRWGVFEPSLHDIQRQLIYDLDATDGLSKLQSFCLTSLEYGYSWAWSDTCCIDKESSAELQEAIGSMFSWYQQSAITLVHLADVSDMGVLTDSEWFKRGWTLQELLAPRSILFFTQDWLLYRGISSNHKEDSTILGELEQATGIASCHLIDFYPSVDDARLRLQWASARLTTRPEDIAYSLFGVFGLHIPILYGESMGSALGRLLAEVIAKSGDTSILDWVGSSSAFHSCLPATITVYKAPAFESPPPKHTASLNILRILKVFSLRSVRKMHQALSRLPPMQFLNFKLILPCVVHRIKTIALTRVGTSTGAHVHRIQATGLEPIEIVLSQPLEMVSKEPVPYVLIRLWHSNLLDPSVMTSDASAHRWISRMQQPFSALLLKELPQNKYSRIASSCHILARATDSAGVLRGEVTMLTVA